MDTPTIQELRELTQQLPERIPYLKMLVLFGSRATGKIHAQSDWDFAALYNQEERKTHIQDNDWGWFGVPLILGESFGINPDKIDVLELNNCSWLIAHFVARDGILLYEKAPGGFEYFRLTSLRPESEMKKFRQQQRQLIEMALQKWGL
ncbi:nucleotidyltransferase domain-containing protein [Scytonema sp. UIC 10036]|uniref:type VII toxin-antitoxin system MntA family adenylyltransferase antitoxin n=1 Tax=Scytonema sp. UIC 10036 TaxID=2304196 RepID=UPI0012DA0F3A|nr:nucleotidyltransferase domain-containing protein [Scytonema sp. UIC 10036]MUG96255.1 nucleotidyltransferase domain-containing protein [Scytonema sp. UIC 10036]